MAGKPGFGGLASKMPIFNGFIVLAFFAGLGLPALSGFISEAMCFIGGFGSFTVLTMIGTLGILLNAIYFLRAYQTVFLGPFNEKYSDLKDMSMRDLGIIIPLAFLTLLFGVYPQPLLDIIRHSMTKIILLVQPYI